MGLFDKIKSKIQEETHKVESQIHSAVDVHVGNPISKILNLDPVINKVIQNTTTHINDDLKKISVAAPNIVNKVKIAVAQEAHKTIQQTANDYSKVTHNVNVIVNKVKAKTVDTESQIKNIVDTTKTDIKKTIGTADTDIKKVVKATGGAVKKVVDDTKGVIKKIGYDIKKNEWEIIGGVALIATGIVYVVAKNPQVISKMM